MRPARETSQSHSAAIRATASSTITFHISDVINRERGHALAALATINTQLTRPPPTLAEALAIVDSALQVEAAADAARPARGRS